MRPFTTRMLEVGELCRHKLNTRDAQQNGTFAARWGQGVFVGIDKMTGRYVMWDSENIVQARSEQRIPDCQKCDKDKVASVALRPQQLHEQREPRVLFRDQGNVADVPKGKQKHRGWREDSTSRLQTLKRSDILKDAPSVTMTSSMALGGHQKATAMRAGPELQRNSPRRIPAENALQRRPADWTIY